MRLLRVVCLLLLASSSAAADGITCVDSLPKPNNCYKLYRPKGDPQGLVVLLPGFGDTVEFFDQYDFPKMMQGRGYLVAAFSMAGYVNWEKDIKTLHTLLSDIVKRHNVPASSLVIGGFPREARALSATRSTAPSCRATPPGARRRPFL